jgi:hypothetical protein
LDLSLQLCVFAGNSSSAKRKERNIECMDDRVIHIIKEIESVARDVHETFGHLNEDQLNWKPAEKSWSVAQCFDHLITINSLYFPLFEQLRSADFKNSFWEKVSPLSGFFGNQLKTRLGPDYKAKMKTSKKAYPSASSLGGDIIERFQEHQRQLAHHIVNISSAVIARNPVITSPLLSFVTYTLEDCLTILTVHERRHFLQAERVMKEGEFPA